MRAAFTMTVAVTVAMALISACAGSQHKEPVESEPILIGTVAPLSGDQAQIGEDMVRGVELAAEDLNAAGGVLGRPVRLVKLDDRADPKEAAATASKLATDDRVVAVVGHLNSGCSIPASAIYHRAGMLMISPVSTADSLTGQGFPEVFRVVLRNSRQGSAAARFSHDRLHVKKVALVDDKTAYGRGIVDAFAQEAAVLGLQVVAHESFTVGEKDYSALVSRLKASDVDMVYAGCMFTEGALLIRQARARGLVVRFMSGDGFFAPKLIELGGASIEGTIVTFLAPPWSETPAAKKLLSRYRELYGGDVKTYAPLAYDATMIVAEAIRRAGNAKRVSVVAALRAPGFSWTGTGATYEFDDHGDIRNPQPYFFEVTNGSFRVMR